jgi:sec-independent protein translocase protein TatC
MNNQGTALQTAPEPGRHELAGMTLLEHLEELRKRIIFSLLGIVAGFAACWYYAELLYGYMQRPIVVALHAHKLPEKLVYLNPTDPFQMYMKIGLIAGIFLASPWVLYQLWLFISPGLYRNEKKYVLPFMVATVGLFLAGGYFGYRIVYPAALDFLIGYGEQFQPMITITEYTDLFMAVVLGLGIVFELPVVIFFLALFGIVDAGFLWRNFRYSILIIFTIAAVVTPTTDILNMCIFAAPMVVLYFISIGIAWFVHPKRRKLQAAQ